MDWLKAAVLYFSTMFAVGFVLGPLRELLIKPWTGGIAAVLIEAPFLITAMILIAPRAMRRARMRKGWSRRAAMSAVSLALILVAEAAGASLLRGWSLTQWLERFSSTEGRIGLALYVVFALVPLFSRDIVTEPAR